MTNQPSELAAADDLRAQVRERYGRIATVGGCCPHSTDSSERAREGSSSSCCGDSSVTVQISYTPEELAGLPEGANLGLGCGNPTALLSLKPGEVVLDLGSGAGVDCFLAARKVGPGSQVIGVDMTPTMVSKARRKARTAGYANVEFRLGEIEHLPVADRSVDVVISNCAINLAPDKGPVYREAFRVLRPGGRLAVSDVVATRPIQLEDRQNSTLWSSCSSGALEIGQLKALLREAGFEEIEVDFRISEKTPESLENPTSSGVLPANITATKPVR